MKIFWENDGEPNDQGEYVAVIDMEDGRGVQRFCADSYKGVADDLLQAQASATNKIAELSPRTPATPPAPGAPATRVEDDDDDDTTPEQVAAIVATAKEFGELAEYKPFKCTVNNMLIVRNMKKDKLDPADLQSYLKVFRELRDDALLTTPPAAPAPALEPGQRQPNQPDGSQPRRIDEGTETVRPRGQLRTTGIRNDDVNREPAPVASRPAQQYTAGDIEAMSEEQLNRLKDKLGPKKFDTLIESLYATKKPAAS